MKNTAYAIVVLTVLAGWWMAGAGQIPVPVAFGLTILAIARFLIVRREEKLTCAGAQVEGGCTVN